MANETENINDTATTATDEPSDDHAAIHRPSPETVAAAKAKQKAETAEAVASAMERETTTTKTAKHLAQCALEAIEGEADPELNPVVSAGDVAACLWVSRVTDERPDDRTVVAILEALEAGDYVRSRAFGPVMVWFNPKASAFYRDYTSDHDAEWPPTR